MSKLYRLPDGAEVRPADSNLIKVQTLANHTWVIHPELGAISCYTGLLTEVKPPLPPAPDAPAVLIGEQVWARDDIKGVGPVFVLPGGPTLDWEELNAHAEAQGKPIVPLVKDPAADAPPVPGSFAMLGGHLVHLDERDGLLNLQFTGGGSARFTNHALARRFAAAIWAWVDRAEANAGLLSVEGKDTNHDH